MGGNQPSRRAVLGGASALALTSLTSLTGCLSAGEEPARPDPDLLLRERVADQVGELVAVYGSVIASFPDARPELGPLADEHRAHVRALRGHGQLSRRRPRPPTAGAGPEFPTVGAARAVLAELERAATARRTRQLREAGPDLARLLASVAACETTHARLLSRATP